MDERYYRDKDGEVHARPAVEYEKLDPTPVAIPARLRRSSNLNEVVRDMVRGEELRRLAQNSGHETFDEADDFEIGDDYDPTSPYEIEFEGDVLRDNYARQEMLKAATKAMPGSRPAEPPTAANGSGDSPSGSEEPKA